MNVDRRKMVEEAQKLLDTYEMNIDANMLVERLTIAQQQMVEIVKAISFNSKILVWMSRLLPFPIKRLVSCLIP